MRKNSITITKRDLIHGGTQISWNVDLNGRPLGAIWTFKPERGCVYPFTFKPLKGDASTFQTLGKAERHIRLAYSAI